ncbi:MAG: RbsD/FucU family protein [Halanaerobiaceae bacterium]
MLKGIPGIISPELMKIIMEMGHGDEIVLADGNFPAASNARRLIRCDGHQIPELLEAILKFFPLDTYVDQPVSLMEVSPEDDYEPEIWEKYQEIIKKSETEIEESQIEFVKRFDFYKRARKAYAIVASGETALYANIILKKGVIPG